MPHHRPRPATLADCPPSLRPIVRAAQVECPRGHGDALLELTVLALRKAPSRGIFDPGARGEHELFVAIEGVAQAHLELADARSAWRDALDAAGLGFERRDEIETAAVRAQAISDTAYFYAGLAFGLVSASRHS